MPALRASVGVPSSILLGVLTYDGNLLLVHRVKPDPHGHGGGSDRLDADDCLVGHHPVRPALVLLQLVNRRRQHFFGQLEIRVVCDGNVYDCN